jgi:hypothetical protein
MNVADFLKVLTTTETIEQLVSFTSDNLLLTCIPQSTDWDDSKGTLH